jgi:signal transduction histidine kinase
VRIARDLHDVMAPTISVVINVQASTALHLKDRHPERAWQPLATSHDVSKQTMVECVGPGPIGQPRPHG